MIDPRQLRELVIRPALEAIGLHSPAAEELVLGTACQESACGRFLIQNARGGGYGPAKGIFQMEPRTHDDIWENYILHNATLAENVTRLSVTGEHFPYADSEELTYNLRYAAAMCRIHYRRVRAALPTVGNVVAQADYWKQYYNTPLGAGTVKEYLDNWRKYAAA